MNIKLINGKALVQEIMPEIIDLNDANGLLINIENYADFTNKLVVTVEYDDTYIQIRVLDGQVHLPINVMSRDVKKVYFTCNGEKFYANEDKLKIKGITNVKDRDMLVEMLALVYNKYVDLERKYITLEEAVASGDLMI